MPKTADIRIGVRLAREEEDGDVVVDFGFFCANLSAREAGQVGTDLLNAADSFERRKMIEILP